MKFKRKEKKAVECYFEKEKNVCAFFIFYLFLKKNKRKHMGTLLFSFSLSFLYTRRRNCFSPLFYMQGERKKKS